MDQRVRDPLIAATYSAGCVIWGTCPAPDSVLTSAPLDDFGRSCDDPREEGRALVTLREEDGKPYAARPPLDTGRPLMLTACV
jgi:hypothetical protein